MAVLRRGYEGVPRPWDELLDAAVHHQGVPVVSPRLAAQQVDHRVAVAILRGVHQGGLLRRVGVAERWSCLEKTDILRPVSDYSIDFLEYQFNRDI